MFLAAAHRIYDTSDSADANLAAFCQGYHMNVRPAGAPLPALATPHQCKPVGDLFNRPKTGGSDASRSHGLSDRLFR